MIPSRVNIGQFHRRILRWYAETGRKLPWRGSITPYATLVSEVMLQQTQVHRVLVKYPRFMAHFPTVRRLAAASQRDVVAAWQGMGYNNRAVRLYRLATHIVHHRKGRWPTDLEGLQALPGVGRYTAHAMMAFAFRKNVPVVDVNVRRVLSRVLWRMRHAGDLRPENEIWDTAHRVLPQGRAYDWNQALMDLGATICTARSPRCERCPVRAVCSSTGRMTPRPREKSVGEPARGGIPARIYRGRVVELLRPRLSGLTYVQLSRLIASEFSHDDVRRLEPIVDSLERDGLVRVIRRRNIPSRVSLA